MPTEIAHSKDAPEQVAREQEAEHLARTLAVIERRLTQLRRERGKSREEMIQYRKYMWEDAGLIDRMDRAQARSLEYAQEQAVIDVAVRLKRMTMLSSSPYFGRIDFRETGTTRRTDAGIVTTPADGDVQEIYIGLYGLTSDKHESLVHDWRAPVSGMFYDGEVGPASYAAPEGTIAGEMTLKRQYKIENGEMVYMLDSSLAINDEILREALARNTTERMRQIVNSIQREQNAVIRDESRKVLVVQGPAGSGKTSIAMHRAAYLLYRHRGHIAANNLLIFSPNEVFADYISNVLPELGEENIREATFEDFARSMLPKKMTFEPKAEQMEFILSHDLSPGPSPGKGGGHIPSPRPSPARGEGAEDLSPGPSPRKGGGHIPSPQPSPARGEGAEDLSPDPSPKKGGEYSVRAASIAFKSTTAFLEIIRAYERHLRHSLKFEDITLNNTRLLPGDDVKALYWEHCAEMPIAAGIERLKDRVLSKCVYSSEFVESKIEKLVEGILPDRDPVRLYKKLFSDFHLVKQLSEGETLPDNLHLVCKHTAKSLRSRKMPVPYEDVAPIILLKRLIEGEPRYANVKHLIIDEAQDYTPVHYEIIRQLFGASSMTIVGDLSQRINPYSGLDSYEALGEILGGDARQVAELTKSYRSSREITEFAHKVLPTALVADNIRRSNREPSVVRAESEEHAARLISDEMKRLQDEGFVSVGVICRTAHEASAIYSKLLPEHDIRLVEASSIAFHHGLVVMPVYLAKGLEFDAVIIHDASREAYASETERKILYTACTRALHSLTLYYHGELSPLVPKG